MLMQASNKPRILTFQALSGAQTMDWTGVARTRRRYHWNLESLHLHWGEVHAAQSQIAQAMAKPWRHCEAHVALIKK